MSNPFDLVNLNSPQKHRTTISKKQHQTILSSKQATTKIYKKKSKHKKDDLMKNAVKAHAMSETEKIFALI